MLAREHIIRGVEHCTAGMFSAACKCFSAALAHTSGHAASARIDDLLNEALADRAAHSESRICMGLALERAGRWEEAAELLERGLVECDGNASAWLALGRSLGRSGRLTEALRSLDHALSKEEHLAEAWSVRGNVLRDLGRLDDAAESFRRAIDSGADAELHRYYLAACLGETLDAAPRTFVESLFDEYSADFDEHLLQQLAYRGHERLLRPLLESGSRFHRVLDLGCGTGLCGALIAPQADVLIGVDVSTAMLEQAGNRDVYDELVHDDLNRFLAAQSRQADLIIAADVFTYVGALDEVFAQIRRLLRPDGIFAFTLERDDEHDFRLLPTLRYAHSEAHVRRLAARHGFIVLDIASAGLRKDQAETLQALYVLLQ